MQLPLHRWSVASEAFGEDRELRDRGSYAYLGNPSSGSPDGAMMSRQRFSGQASCSRQYSIAFLAVSIQVARFGGSGYNSSSSYRWRRVGAGALPGLQNRVPRLSVGGWVRFPCASASLPEV